MKPRECKQMRDERRAIREHVDNAGNQSDLQAALMESITKLGYQCERTKAWMENLQRQYKEKRERWSHAEVPPGEVPFPITEDCKTAHRYLTAGYSCLGFESLLGTAIFMTFLQFPWWLAILAGTLVAVFAAAIFEGSIEFLFRQVDRPKQMLNDIRRWLLWPSFFLFGVLLLIWLAARSVTNDLALVLEPVMQVAIWLSTLSLLSLGSALLAAGSIVSWSAAISSEYRAVQEEHNASQILREAYLNRRKSLDQHAPSILLPSRSLLSRNP